MERSGASKRVHEVRSEPRGALKEGEVVVCPAARLEGRERQAAWGILSETIREIPGRSIVTPWMLSARCIVR